MSRFKAGDVVTVHKPKNTGQHPGWTPYMDRFDKDSLVVEKVIADHYSETVCSLRGGGGYVYNILWLKPDEPFGGNI